MELLTGKAKDDFEYWLLTERNEIIIDRSTEYDLYYMFQYMLPHSIKCQLIIDWLDSVGLKICTEPLIDSSFRVFLLTYMNLNNWIDDRFESRAEANIAAINKANEIYNER